MISALGHFPRLRSDSNLSHSSLSRSRSSAHTTSAGMTPVTYQALGRAIPILTRIVVSADACDTMCAKRVYKTALLQEQVIRRIMPEQSAQSNPDVVDCFVQVADQFKEIAATPADFIDTDTTPQPERADHRS